jgi:hypothetical protein
MDQQTYNRIIESGQPIEITAEFLAAAQANGRRQRSEVVANGWVWLRGFLRSTMSYFRSTATDTKHCNQVGAPCV